jgi:hypothetical protein
MARLMFQSPFRPSGAGVQVAVGAAASAAAALPAAPGGVYRIVNDGPATSFLKLGDNTVVATTGGTGELRLLPNSVETITRPSGFGTIDATFFSVIGVSGNTLQIFGGEGI